MGNVESKKNDERLISTKMTESQYNEYNNYLKTKQTTTNQPPSINKNKPISQNYDSNNINNNINNNKNNNNNLLQHKDTRSSNHPIDRNFNKTEFVKQLNTNNLNKPNVDSHQISKEVFENILNQKSTNNLNGGINRRPIIDNNIDIGTTANETGNIINDSSLKSQPRMNIILQDKKKLSKVIDTYEELYQKRQMDGNIQYLQTLKIHGNVNYNNKKFEMTQQEMERLKTENTVEGNDTKINNNEIEIDINENNIASYSDQELLLKKFSIIDDQYKLLNITESSSIEEINKSYRLLTKYLHPDKGGTIKAFNKLRDAYQHVINKNKLSLGNSSFQEMKNSFDNYKEYDIEGAPLGKGESFDNNQFNNIYNENRINDVNDTGYNDWIEESPYNTIEIKQTLNQKFNSNKFNTTFDSLKNKNNDKNDLIKYIEPEAAFNCNGVEYSNLGEDNINDFSKSSIGDSNSLGYTDYKKALSNTQLINTSKHVIKKYKNLEELEKERDNVKFDMNNHERLTYDKKQDLESKQEDSRRERVVEYDSKIRKQYQSINNRLKS